VRIARISYVRKKVFVIMALSWSDRSDLTSRERAYAS
jgi:hypothetical protein